MHKKHTLFKNVDNFIFWSLFSHAFSNVLTCSTLNQSLYSKWQKKPNIGFYTLFILHIILMILIIIKSIHTEGSCWWQSLNEFTASQLHITFHFESCFPSQGDPLWKSFFLTFVVEKLTRDLCGSSLKWILNNFESQKMTAEQF
jgi:hypothetical protein